MSQLLRSGWLAAASALARRAPGDATHVILMPEAPVAPSALLQRVAHQVASKGWAVVVVAEELQLTLVLVVVVAMALYLFGLGN